jgi:hypothetical protein
MHLTGMCTRHTKDLDHRTLAWLKCKLEPSELRQTRQHCMFQFFLDAIIRHRHIHVAENKHFIYNTLLIKKVTEILILQLFI